MLIHEIELFATYAALIKLHITISDFIFTSRWHLLRSVVYFESPPALSSRRCKMGCRVAAVPSPQL